jgi:hypothetical protein
MRGRDRGKLGVRSHRRLLSRARRTAGQGGDFPASSAFYDAVLAPLGGQRIMELKGAVGYGVPPRPTFSIPTSTTFGALNAASGCSENDG